MWGYLFPMSTSAQFNLPGRGESAPDGHDNAPRKSWLDTLVTVILWLVAAWVAWDFVHCVDPIYREDPKLHPPRISPRGLDPDNSH